MASYSLGAMYGKQSVPVFKVRKFGARHEVVDLLVQIMLDGKCTSWGVGRGVRWV